MNDDATNIDQADEETLTTMVSDETLEAAAGANTLLSRHSIVVVTVGAMGCYC
jgi:hypothetical protein